MKTISNTVNPQITHIPSAAINIAEVFFFFSFQILKFYIFAIFQKRIFEFIHTSGFLEFHKQLFFILKLFFIHFQTLSTLQFLLWKEICEEPSTRIEHIAYVCFKTVRILVPSCILRCVIYI